MMEIRSQVTLLFLDGGKGHTTKGACLGPDGILGSGIRACIRRVLCILLRNLLFLTIGVRSETQGV